MPDEPAPDEPAPDEPAPDEPAPDEPAPDEPAIDKNALLSSLEQEIAFQKKWKTITMASYAATTVGTILCTSSATLLAASNFAAQAAIVAGLATVLITTEKSLLFREKWRLHLTVFTKLKNVRRALELNFATVEATAAKMQRILEEYSSELPIAPREQ